MNFSLGCGAILEPFIGIVTSSIIIFFLLIYFIKISVKSNFYQNEFSEFNNPKKIVMAILFLLIVICVLVLTFFILSFTITGFIMTLKKWI